MSAYRWPLQTLFANYVKVYKTLRALRSHLTFIGTLIGTTKLYEYITFVSLDTDRGDFIFAIGEIRRKAG